MDGGEKATRRAESEKRAFREELEIMVGSVEAHVIMSIASEFNALNDEKRTVRGTFIRQEEEKPQCIGVASVIQNAACLY